MPCASCGGGKSLSPNRPVPMTYPTLQQSNARIVTTPHGGASSGLINRTNPNTPIPTKRTTV